MSSDILNGLGTKKRRRPRKRSRKSKLKKTNENETNSDDSGLQDSSATTADIKVKSEAATRAVVDGHSEDKCGCQIEKKRRRRSRRRKKKFGLVDILSCETIDDYTTDDYFIAQDLEFVVPAFKVHQRCEHPMYVPKAVVPEAVDPIPAVTEAEPGPEDTQNVTVSLAHPPKRTKILEQQDCQGGISESDDVPVLSPECASEPVNSVDDVNKGDIIYFDQLTLRGSEPVIERRMAKVFLVMKDPGSSNGPSILLRTYVGFDALNPATWYPKEHLLSAEPLIIKFEELHEIKRMSTTL